MKMQLNPADFLVLICDDEESIRSMLEEVVKEWGFQVMSAPNGEAALELFDQGYVPHVILTDIRMGGITGIELAAKAKKMSDEIQVVIMTSHGSLETAVQAMRIGVFDYLSKPFDNIEDVRTSLLHVCERIHLKYFNEYLLSELQKKNQVIEIMAKMSTELAANRDISAAVDIGCRAISKAFNCATVFFQYIAENGTLIGKNRSPTGVFGATQPAIAVPSEATKDSTALIEFIQGLDSDRDFHMVLAQAEKANEFPEQNQIFQNENSGWKVYPVVDSEAPRGVLAVYGPELEDGDNPMFLDQYVRGITIALHSAILNFRTETSATIDGLTGLYNVRYFKGRMKAEMDFARRYHRPASLLFFDVDHFKKYNDTHGHPAGDEVLRRVSALMKKSFRTSDVCCRYGGEEFVIILPSTAFPDALNKAEAFRKLLEETPFPNEHTQPLGKVTVSIGVAEFPGHGSTMEAIIKAADDALYEGKKKSRNVVVPGIKDPSHIPEFEYNASTLRSVRIDGA